jgi:hypothetical protein
MIHCANLSHPMTARNPRSKEADITRDALWTDKPGSPHRSHGKTFTLDQLICGHNCPQNAIHLKSERSSARFRNAEVKVSEINAANNQQS